MRKPLPAGLRKHVTVNCIPLVGIRRSRRRIADAGHFFTPESVDTILAQEAELIEKFFPGAEFHLVSLRNGDFNFVQTKQAELAS